MLLELDFKKRNLTLIGTLFAGLILTILSWNNPLALALVIGTLVYFLTGTRPTIVYAIVATLRRDITVVVRFAKLNILLIKWSLQRKTVPLVFRDIVRQHPKKVAFILDDQKWSFQEVEDFSNRIGSYFKSKGLKRGETVALLMESRPEYPAIWLGLCKIGVTTALINTNLRKDVLIHSITVAGSKAIIVSSDLKDALWEIKSRDEIKSIPTYEYKDVPQSRATILPHLPDPGSNSVDLVDELDKHKLTDITEDICAGRIKDKMVYVYTSGTTGLPKAAVITHVRYMFMSMGGRFILALRKDDIIYNPLPIYHTAGGILGVGSVLLAGLTMVMRKKFSASNFWPDCIKYECTVAQYIGELCRFLLAVPPKPTDTQHKVRLMFGNGLRPQIWKQFVSRFDIQDIGELYGSTEGNSNLANFDNQIGAIGFVPLSARHIYPVTLVKCDEDTGEPIRGPDGRCIRCKPGEAGVFIGKINPKIVCSSFSGYADKKATEKKIIRNVFKDCDMYFNSGDILVRDILGYFYFKDRTGDTFRWRGENVSTSEVEAVISNILGLKDCVVYGVEIPHVEGRAGMAAIVDVGQTVDMETFSVGIRGSLPPYSRPLFVRVLPELPMTGTFKLKKKDLQGEGFDIDKIKEPLYYLSRGVYRPFTRQDYDNVMNGEAGL